MPHRFRLDRCVFLIATLLLAGAGARASAASLDLKRLVVCGVPPTEAVAYTQRHEERLSDRNRPKVRWTAVGPDSNEKAR